MKIKTKTSPKIRLLVAQSRIEKMKISDGEIKTKIEM